MEKKRRSINMEETKKELKIEGIEEIQEKAVEKTKSTVRDYVDITSGLAGLVRENYIAGFQLFFISGRKT
jgi:hypothetical protein